MASAVVSDNFETGSGGVPQLGGADRQNQWCKAWVNFNGTGTVAIRDSFNVSSITDYGTGKHTVNFTTNFANSNISVMGHINYSQALNSGHSIYCSSNYYATNKVDVFARSYNGTFYDCNAVSVQVFSN